MSDYKYRAFISYSRKDAKFVAWLHKKLENYNIPESLRTQNPHLPKKLGTFFKDTEDLAVHSSLDNVLKGVLQESEFLIVVCSLSSSQSHWVNEEIKYFKSIGREDRIIPVIIEGEPNATSNPDFENSYEVYPEALRFKVDEKGKLEENGNNPIGADFRKGKDTNDKALTRIIARILDVNFDDIWQRERKRKFIKKVLLSIIGLVMLSIITFGIYKWINEIQLRAINSELSKIVKDGNTTKVDTAALEDNISRNLRRESEINEIEDRVIKTRQTVQNEIKHFKVLSQTLKKVKAPSFDPKEKSMEACKRRFDSNLFSINNAIREAYCKCLFTETMGNMKGDKSNLNCEAPIRAYLGLPKTSQYRDKKLKEAKQRRDVTHQYIENMKKDMIKINEKATKENNERMRDIKKKGYGAIMKKYTKNIPELDSKTRKFIARYIEEQMQNITKLATKEKKKYLQKFNYVLQCTSVNYEKLPKIDVSLVKDFCQCSYDETTRVIGEINVFQRTLWDDKVILDPHEANIDREKKRKKIKEYWQQFQTESKKHQGKCMEPIRHLIPTNR